MTALADKEQPFLGSVLLADESAARAGLAGVVGIYLHAKRTGQNRLVVQEALQFGKGPRGRMPVGFLLFRSQGQQLLACAPLLWTLRSVSNASQVFQTNETVRMGVKNLLTDHMIGIQLQPSLSLAQDNTSPGGAASAFALKPLLEAGVVVCLVSNFLSAIKLRASIQGGYGCQVTLPDINTHNARMTFWRGIRGRNRQTDQQIEAFATAIIPEFGRAKGGTLLQKCHMLGVALIGGNDSAFKRQDADLLVGFQGIVSAKVVGERRGDVVGGLIQPFKAFLGEP